MKTLLLGSAIFLSLCACDGADDNPTNARPPAPVGTPVDTSTSVAAPPPGQQCTQQAKICKDGSVAMITPGTCEQSCPGE